MIETDVRQTRDGHLVLFHDPSVGRTTNGNGLVAELTLTELKGLDAGAWFAAEFAGQRIPTVQEFLVAYHERIPTCFEIKSPGIEESLYSLVERHGALDTAYFTSFLPQSVRRVKEIAPPARVGLLTPDFDREHIEQTLALGAEQICPPAAKLSSRRVALAHEAGLQVRVWGAESDQLVERAIVMGADGVTTNWPDRVRRKLHEVQAWMQRH